MAPNGKIFPILFLAICSSVGQAKPPSKIVNGQNAPNTPYQVSIISDNISHRCGGSIIDKRHIITAAHCVIKNGAPYHKPLSVLIGTNDKTNRNGNNIYRVVRWFSHEAYAPHDSWKNDIAILKVDKNIAFNEFQKPISLPMNDTPVGKSVNLTGWGETRAFKTPPEKYPRYLQTISTKVVTQEQCQKLNPKVRIQEGQICTWTGGHGGACKADSGGPLVDGSYLVGIVSFGRNCAPENPDVFTRVYHYVPWIRETIAKSYSYND